MHISASGLAPRALVTVTLSSTDAAHVRWRSSAEFRTSSSGRLALDRADPVTGDYAGVWGGGLLATLQPVHGFHFYAWGTSPRTFTVSVRTSNGRRAVARARRTWTRFSIATMPMTVARNGFYGVFDTPATARRHEAVLLFGGSEGGLSTGGIAYRLAAHGYPALAIGYFRAKGLPKLLVHIELEYFVRALRWLDARPEVDPKRIVVLGISRGSEAAQLLGAYFPGLVHAVIASVPSNTANWSGWDLRGKPLPTAVPGVSSNPRAVIPVERIRGPELTVCGGSDQVWTSCAYADLIRRRLRSHHHPYHDVFLKEPVADHFVGGLVPFNIPAFATPSDEQARERVWPKVLAFLQAAAA
jgi:dienelactone hydrolase